MYLHSSAVPPVPTNQRAATAERAPRTPAATDWRRSGPT